MSVTAPMTLLWSWMKVWTLVLQAKSCLWFQIKQCYRCESFVSLQWWLWWGECNHNHSIPEEMVLTACPCSPHWPFPDRLERAWTSRDGWKIRMTMESQAGLLLLLASMYSQASSILVEVWAWCIVRVRARARFTNLSSHAIEKKKQKPAIRFLLTPYPSCTLSRLSFLVVLGRSCQCVSRSIFP